MISERLTTIIAKELDLDDLELLDDTTADEVPGWDSLSHVRILSAVERAFAIRFTTVEALRLDNVGALQRLVDSKLGG